MRTYLIIIFILSATFIKSQHKVIALDLKVQDIKKKSVPFYFKDIIFLPKISDTLGIIATKNNGTHTLTTLKKNKTESILNFLQSQFEENKKASPIFLEITELRLAPTEKNKFSFTDTFHFQCNFFGILNNERTSLYTFKAKNQFGTFQDAEIVMANYVVRALISAVEKFKDSFEKKAEWHQEFENESNAEKKPIKVNAILNNISSQDSIACTFEKKLSWIDFQENLQFDKNKKDNIAKGSAKYILTYQAASEESSKQLKLDICVKAILYKSNSWKPANVNEDSWLTYQQGHFDICAVYGVLLYNIMKNYKYNLGNFKSELNKIYNDVHVDYVFVRKQYQHETEDGKNEAQMLLWRKKIDGLVQANTKK